MPAGLLSSRPVNLIDRVARPQVQVRRYLIVSAAAGMELPSGVPELCDQRGLNVHVDVFQANA